MSETKQKVSVVATDEAINIIFNMAPVELDEFASSLKGEEIHKIEMELEAIAEKAGRFASYLGERYGYGCGDQGHDSALKMFNQTGKRIHCLVFGYNAYIPGSF